MLLARIEGIECYQITGYATQSTWVAHAWNKVRIDGIWYCIDATWGNIYLKEKKYVTHRYFMIDDGTFSKDHMETIDDNHAAVDNLAIGNVEYYKSVETSTGHTLYVKNYGDLKAAITYYLNAGCHYVEFMVDPSYKPTIDNVGAAYKEVTGNNYSITSSVDGNIVLAYIESI